MTLGLFIGLTTLDFIYLTPRIPEANQKLVAIDALTASGGPATNAAMTFQSLGNQSRLLSAVGQHPMTPMIRHDLVNLDLWDLVPDSLESPPISSVLVTESTGDRAVISINSKRSRVETLPSGMDAGHILKGVDIVLIDGHQMSVSIPIAALAKSKGIPIVLDGGSWKLGFESVLPYVDYAICSANFSLPDLALNSQALDSRSVFDFLATFRIPFAAITQGPKPILYGDRGKFGTVEVPVIQAVDTLGAGDIFHGAFCHYILHQDFSTALSSAATIAARSCERFGTRAILG
jgi:sugar/nucleoside kinase (ribokinase family)